MPEESTPTQPQMPPRPATLEIPTELVEATLAILIEMPFSKVADVVLPLRAAATTSYHNRTR